VRDAGRALLLVRGRGQAGRGWVRRPAQDLSPGTGQEPAEAGGRDQDPRGVEVPRHGGHHRRAGSGEAHPLRPGAPDRSGQGTGHGRRAGGAWPGGREGGAALVSTLTQAHPVDPLDLNPVRREFKALLSFNLKKSLTYSAMGHLSAITLVFLVLLAVRNAPRN